MTQARPGARRLALAPALLLALSAGAASAQTEGEAPLSAIDWLSQSLVAPPAAPAPQPPEAGRTGPGSGAVPGETPVADSATVPDVSTRSLGAPSPDGVGLLGPRITGLPGDLWSASDAAQLITLIRALDTQQTPAMQELTRLLMLAEAQPPLGASGEASFLLARTDRLLDMGALQEAQAMLEQVGLDTPEVTRRWFDIALLTGTEDAACAAMLEQASLSPTLPTRIFCLAREGDWPAAAVTLNSATALGTLDPEIEDLLHRFLDDNMHEGAEPLRDPSRPSPLVFRMREAIGEALPSRTLPLAFAQADLRDTNPWRVQIEAAERLVRAGGLDPAVLFALYGDHAPAASGGVWDRAAAIQALEAALRAGPPAAGTAPEGGTTATLDEALPPAWEAMEQAGLQVPFARHYAQALLDRPLEGETAALAQRIALLSPLYETAARGLDDPLAAGIAAGETAGIEPADPREAALAAAFADHPVPEPLQALVEAGKPGEAMLRAIATFDQGVSAEPQALADALALLRSLGLEDIARRAALQVLLLDRPA